jgi:Glyoxalase/Bleomycin resistance protein/Dioxygenase superfamily
LLASTTSPFVCATSPHRRSSTRMPSVSAWTAGRPVPAPRGRHRHRPTRAAAGDAAQDRFSEARIGFDHIAFRVETPTELEELSRRLRRMGAEVGEPEHDPHSGGVALTFRDLDNIQLEFYLPLFDRAEAASLDPITWNPTPRAPTWVSAHGQRDRRGLTELSPASETALTLERELKHPLEVRLGAT